MVYFYILAGLAVLLIGYMRFEAGFVEVNRVRFTKSKNCLKILHLSDIHIRRLKVPVKKVLGAIRDETPDVIILTGDYVEKPCQVEDFLEFLGGVTAFGIPTYLSLGNHDYIAFEGDRKGLRRFIRSIEGTGAEVLTNRSIFFEKDGKKYNMIGMDDLKQGSPDFQKALEYCGQEVYMSIAFSHNPDIILEIPEGKVDYLLCGHFHGGQIWLPFRLECKILRRDKLCRMGIRWGLHKLKGINFYINRGLGNVLFPLRFGARPEITVYCLP